MTPSNPDNSQPLIYRIADSLGVFHLVAPVNHVHSISEITALEAVLDGKAPVGYIPEKIQKSVSDSTTHVHANGEEIEFFIEDTSGEEPVESTATLDINNMANFVRAISTPDDTPTENSDKLVKSGGVATAIKNAAQKVTFNTNIPYTLSVVEKGLLYTSIFINRTGSAVKLSDCFDITTLPPAEQNIRFNVDALNVEIANNESFGVRFMRSTTGVYIWYDGLFEY